MKPRTWNLPEILQQRDRGRLLGALAWRRSASWACSCTGTTSPGTRRCDNLGRQYRGSLAPVHPGRGEKQRDSVARVLF